jgi:hypothetical protein
MKTTATIVVVTLTVAQTAYASTHARHTKTRGVTRTAGLTGFIWHKSGTARVLAPENWVIVTNAQGNAVDVSGPGYTEYVGWSISAVTPEMMEFYPIYRNPEQALAYGLSLTTRGEGDPSAAHLTSAPKQVGDGFFTMRTFESAKKEGAVFYHTYPMANGGFIASIFEAMADKPQWEKHKGVLIGMALSIRSTVLFRPVHLSDVGAGHAGSSVDEQDKELKGYNAQLGTQWVHSRSTGDVYDVDASSWRENGPDGPGYYHQNGNDIEKLEPGMGD